MMQIRFDLPSLDPVGIQIPDPNGMQKGKKGEILSLEEH